MYDQTVPGDFGATESLNQVKEEPAVYGVVEGVSEIHASVATAATADVAAVAASATMAVDSRLQCSRPKATDLNATSALVKITHPAAVGIVPEPPCITGIGSGMARIKRGSSGRVGGESMTSNRSEAKRGDRDTRGKRSRDDTPPHRKTGRLCNHKDCPRRPCFGFEGDQSPSFCKEHKIEGHVDIVTRRCERTGCNITPSFRFEGDKRTRFCAAHKMDGMTDIHRDSRSCKYGKGCQINPSFGFEGGKRISCSKHRLKGMINLNLARRCHQEGCRRVPNFAMPGQAPTSCGSHRSQGMINVVSKRCEVGSCDRIPSYNFDQPGAKAAFCSQHKADGMVNVRHQRCSHPGCLRQPSFGAAGGKVATFCKEHKTPEMVDVKNTAARKEAAKIRQRVRKPASAD